MLITKQEKMVYIFGLLAIFFVPFYFLNFPGLPDDSRIAPLVVAVEVLIYFVFILLNFKGIQCGVVIIFSFILTLIRFVSCLVSAIFMIPTANFAFGVILLKIWVANPLSVLVQVFMLILFAPWIAGKLLPGIAYLNQLEEVKKGESAPPEKINEASLIYGELINITNFTDLTNYLKKFPGVLGYILFNKEGLIVSESLPPNTSLNKDDFTSKVAALNNDIASSMSKYGIKPPEDFYLGINGFKIFLTRPNENFGLILFTSKDTLYQKFFHKLDMIKKTVDEFLKSRYKDVSNIKK